MEVACCFIPALKAQSQTGLRLALLSQFDCETQVLVVARWVLPWWSRGEGSQSTWGKRLPVRGSVEQQREEFTAAVRGREERPAPGAVCLQKALDGKRGPGHSGTRGHTFVNWSGPSQEVGDMQI